ncbi:MAG TPA: alpha/beta hydrolase [Elusimicrobiales bacterium]|nr:alpha/beta hydrolase [Elusimicrobiales bacterium]
MTVQEIFYWLLFSLLALSAGAVWLAWLKSFSIIRPARMKLAHLPDQFRLAYEPVVFPSTDGVALRGWFIPAGGERSSRTIVFCHGWGSNKSELMRDTNFLAGLGFNLFYFDFRASGESAGGMASVGYLETRDLEAAFAWLQANRPEACAGGMGLFGLSMGASVAMWKTARRPEVKCLLAENVFLSYTRVIANWGWRRLKVPFYPLIPMILFFVRLKLGADPEPYSPVHTAPSVKQPVLFVQGDQDELVPQEEAKLLYEICGSSEKALWTVTGAGHAKCAEVGGEAYRRKVAEFFQTHLPPEPEPAEPPPGAVKTIGA